MINDLLTNGDTINVESGCWKNTDDPFSMSFHFSNADSGAALSGKVVCRQECAGQWVSCLYISFFFFHADQLLEWVNNIKPTASSYSTVGYIGEQSVPYTNISVALLLLQFACCALPLPDKLYSDCGLVPVVVSPWSQESQGCIWDTLHQLSMIKW